VTISEALSPLSRLPSPLLGTICDLTSLVTLTGIAAKKTIPVHDIMLYRVTAGYKGKQRQCLQSETFLAHSHNCLCHNYIEITTGTLSTGTSLTSTKIVVS